MNYERSSIVEIEIPIQLYELLLIETTKTGSAVEEIMERCFKNFLEGRIDDIAY